MFTKKKLFIRNNFPEKKIYKLATEVYSLIKNEDNLTNRDIKEIRKWLSGGFLYLALINNQIIGFIAREKTINNFYEIKSWFVRKEYRENGIGGKLIKQAIKKEGLNYLMATFQEKIIKRTAKLGFKKTIFTKLSLSVVLKYLSKRNLSSILKHLFKERSVLLIKYAAN